MATHMSTIVSRKTADILTHISQLRTSLLHRPLLYTISVSQQTNSADLSQLVSSIKSLSSNSVGCLSAPIPSVRSAWQQYTAVSVASFDEQHATLFRSTIPGRKAVQVGRWHALRQKDEQADTRDYSQNIDWEGALSKSYDSDALPPALQDLPVDDVDSIVYLSDNAPEGLNSALSKFSSASKLGLIATSTPFVTGRPHSLFHGDSVYSDGAVGVCLSSPVRSTPQSEFPGLEAITRPMIVTSTEGNLVNALDNANPSRLLLHAIQNHPSVVSSVKDISKDLRLYLGTLRQQDGAQQLDQVFHIMSGDPSRGSIALDTNIAPQEGTLVQIFLSPSSVNPDVLGEVQKHLPERHSLTFTSTSLDDLEALSSSSATTEGPDTVVLPNIFLAASENGCIVSRRLSDEKSERPWKCVVPGSLLGLQ
ncbi:hypothetical protein C8Q74DRAFT_1270062 [Fomes fomentarius]|nr:hypothetical protein C8Q74DRAFT_1270062 [Fomes fomentarius]